MSFQSLGLHARILQATENAGYTEATPIQAKTIPAILSGDDLIGLAQTGTGKTAAFTLPLLSKLVENNHEQTERATRVLIIAPTRELVQQINQSIRSYGKFTNLRTAMVMGGASEKHQIEKLQSNVDIVIATPGRLMALMKEGYCHFGKLTHLVLDEADRMLDMGFLPDIQEISQSLPKRRQSLLFSATFPTQVEKLAKSILKKPRIIEVGLRKNPARTVVQSLYPVAVHLKTRLLISLLDDHQFFSVIVFVGVREQADIVAKDLRAAGITVESIHGDRTQNHRSRALRDFKSSKLRVLVATDIAARGLDIPNVTHVVNYDFPRHSDDYIHRIGRTGRAGAEGCAITFCMESDIEKLKKLERHIGKTLPKKFLDGFNYKIPVPDEDESTQRKSRSHSGNRYEKRGNARFPKTAKKRTKRPKKR